MPKHHRSCFMPGPDNGQFFMRRSVLLEVMDRMPAASVVRIQAVWRGFALRRVLPDIVASLYADRLVDKCWQRLTQRQCSKILLRVRNLRIKLLRLEVKRYSGIAGILYRRKPHEELEAHMSNAKHQLRATMFIQAWWRGCQARGWVGRCGGPRRSKAEHLAFFVDCPKGGPGRQRDREPPPQALSSAYYLAFGNPWLGSSITESLYLPELPVAKDVLPELPGLPDWAGVRSSISSSLQSFTSTLWQEQRRDPGSGRHRARAAGAKPLHMPRYVLIFYSDTGGGHRASALALGAALQCQYGDQVEVHMVDFIREAMPWPWCKAPEAYQYMGHLPSLYKTVYDHEGGHRCWRDTNTFKMLWYFNRDSVLRYLNTLESEGIDVIISVHPLVHHLVVEALEEISADRGTMPIVTVVTDLGSAHLSWFDARVDLLFVPTEEMRTLALEHEVEEERIRVCGLPLREGFWRELDGPEPAACAKKRMQGKLGLVPVDDPEVVLVMGGGEGFGNLVDVATSIGNALDFYGRGQMVVVCGRNAEVKRGLDQWLDSRHQLLRSRCGHQILGFVSNIDEYMSAADCLVTKAGPGTIAEAMTKGLPCLLTSFVPGQEEGNIAFLEDSGAGAYIPDTKPSDIADTIVAWLADASLLQDMSVCAHRLGRPQAALDITRIIGESVLDLGAEHADSHGTAAPGFVEEGCET